MIQETEGIVLRNVKYGDTSLVSTIYTRAFGLQSYLIQGVRSDKKSANKANLFQPGNELNLMVYHVPNKNLQRIREARMHYWFEAIHQVMVKQSVMVFCVELFSKVVTQPETNEELYEFLSNAIRTIDTTAVEQLANFHLQFSLSLAQWMGFGIQERYSDDTPVLDLMQGNFVSASSPHGLEFTDGFYAKTISELNQIAIEDGYRIALHREQRLDIIHVLIRYLQLHVQSMGKIKSLDVLPDILS